MGVVAQRYDQGQISFERTNDSTLVVQFSGPWHLQRDLPAVSVLLSELASRPGTKRLSFETAQLTHWDSGLIAFLTHTTRFAARAASPRTARGFRRACGACSNWPRRFPKRKAREARPRAAPSLNVSETSRLAMVCRRASF